MHYDFVELEVYMGKTGYEHPGRFCFNFLKILYLLDIETVNYIRIRIAARRRTRARCRYTTHTISTPNEQTELVFSDEGYGQTY